jgi:MFS family permease
MRVRPGSGVPDHHPGSARCRGGLLTPRSLAIRQASFRPADRGRAIGAWSGLGGIAVAAGPLVGGYLISAASWRWIFFINFPIALVVIALSAHGMSPSRATQARAARLTTRGAGAVLVFLFGTTFAFIEAPALGWLSPVVLAMVLLGVAGLAVLLQHAAHNVHQQPDIRAGVSFAGRRSASASPRDASTVLRFISATVRRSPCSAMSSPDWPVTGETGNLGLLGKAGQVTAPRGQRQLQ